MTVEWKEGDKCYYVNKETDSEVECYFLEDVDSEDKCKVPETDACYEGPDGNYVWGRYGDDPNYTLVPSVTELSQCTKDVPVEPTASDVSKVVYVFMAVLMACGIGFIYYSSVVKKSNQ